MLRTLLRETMAIYSGRNFPFCPRGCRGLADSAEATCVTARSARARSIAEKRGHRGAGQAFEERAAEYRDAADVLRKALWQSEPKLPLQAPRKKIAPQP